jgi:hypothetical protein
MYCAMLCSSLCNYGVGFVVLTKAIFFTSMHSKCTQHWLCMTQRYVHVQYMYKRVYLYACAPEAAVQTVFIAWLRACSSAWGQGKVTGCSEHTNRLLGTVKRRECLEELRNFSFWRRPLFHVIRWLVRYFRSVRGWGWKTVFCFVISPQVLSRRVVPIWGHVWAPQHWPGGLNQRALRWCKRVCASISANSDVVIYSLCPLFSHFFQSNVTHYPWLSPMKLWLFIMIGDTKTINMMPYQFPDFAAYDNSFCCVLKLGTSEDGLLWSAVPEQ